MSRPTRQQFARAQDLGEAARRANRPASENPHIHENTERARILAEAWQEAWELKDRRKG